MFLAIFEIAKKWNFVKTIIYEIDLVFDFTSFLAWTFLYFLAHCGVLYKQVVLRLSQSC